MKIRLADKNDFVTLQEIERAAGAPFAEIGMREIAMDEPFSLETLLAYQQEGQAWVYTDKNDQPIAYILIDLVDNCAHIEQVSVHPNWALKRIGRSLIDHVSVWAKEKSLDAVTLTTFTEVAWNGPYYKKCGFYLIPEPELTPGLKRIRAEEAKHGLDRWPRACMRRDL